MTFDLSPFKLKTITGLIIKKKTLNRQVMSNPNSFPDSYNNDQSSNPWARQQGGGGGGNQQPGGNQWGYNPQPQPQPANNGWGNPQPSPNSWNNPQPSQPNSWGGQNPGSNPWGNPSPSPQPFSKPTPYTGDGWDLSVNPGGYGNPGSGGYGSSDPPGKSVQTPLGLVKIVSRSLSPPSGWRNLSINEGRQIKSNLEEILDEWSIVAFDHGKLTGPGYGLTI